MLIITTSGVYKTRNVRRRPELERWDCQFLMTLKGTLWNPNPAAGEMAADALPADMAVPMPAPAPVPRFCHLVGGAAARIAALAWRLERSRGSSFFGTFLSSGTLWSFYSDDRRRVVSSCSGLMRALRLFRWPTVTLSLGIGVLGGSCVISPAALQIGIGMSWTSSCVAPWSVVGVIVGVWGEHATSTLHTCGSSKSTTKGSTSAKSRDRKIVLTCSPNL